MASLEPPHPGHQSPTVRTLSPVFENPGVENIMMMIGPGKWSVGKAGEQIYLDPALLQQYGAAKVREAAAEATTAATEAATDIRVDFPIS